MRLFVIIVTFFVCNSVCRRHHHYHYHLDKNLTHEDNERSQKITTIETNDNSSPGYTTYTKHGPGRHVCSSHKTIPQPVKTVQTFCKPTYKKYVQRCNDNQLCTGVKLVFETAYRDVYIKNTKQVDFQCCPGWVQITKTSHGCNKPVCSTHCQNGGSCVRPDVCSCPTGFKGKYCEIDIDECKEQKPCEQICHNTAGSYKCDCREMFALQPDGHSCKLEEEEEEPDVEARDLEFELLDKRLYKIETMLNDVSKDILSKVSINDINNKVDSLTTDLKTLKNKIHETEINSRDLKVMKNKIYLLEIKANKMDDYMKYVDNSKRSTYNNRV